MLAARANLMTATTAVVATVKPSTTRRVGPNNSTPAHNKATTTTMTRRSLGVSLFTTAVGGALVFPTISTASTGGGDKIDMKALIRAFDDAMAAGEDFEAADKAWTRAIGRDGVERGEGEVRGGR